MTLWHVSPLNEGRGGGVETCLLAEARLLAAAGVQVTINARTYSGQPVGYRVRQSPFPLWLDGLVPVDKLVAMAFYAGVAAGSLRADVLDAHNAPFVAAMDPARTLVTVQTLPVLPGYAWLWRRYRRARYACCSEHMRTEFLKAYPRLVPERVDILNPGVDPDVFTPRPEPRGDRPLRLLYAGQWANVKGIDVLMAALDRLEATAPDLPVYEVWLAGSARLWRGHSIEQEAPAIERQVMGWVQRHPNVRVIGAVPHDQMPELYRSVDALVLPSKSETFGMVLIEAMASQVPVVAFAVGGIPEVVIDGETGLLVRERSAETLAGALASMLRHPERLETMGAAGRKHVLARFSWQAHMVRLWELYRRVNPRIGPSPF